MSERLLKKGEDFIFQCRDTLIITNIMACNNPDKVSFLLYTH